MSFLEFVGGWHIFNCIFGCNEKVVYVDRQPKQKKKMQSDLEKIKDKIAIQPMTSENTNNIYYGSKHFFKFRDNNLFKISMVQQIGCEDYAELDFDDILYIRSYKDKQRYYSFDGREWLILRDKQAYTFNDNYVGYLWVSDEVAELYRYADTLFELKYREDYSQT